MSVMGETCRRAGKRVGVSALGRRRTRVTSDFSLGYVRGESLKRAVSSQSFCMKDTRRRPNADTPIRFPTMLGESFRIAAQQIAANRSRSILTTFGVIIGIVAVTLMGTAIRGIDIGFDRSMSGFGDDVLYVEQWPWNTGDDYWQFRNRPDIKLSFADRLNQMIEENPNSLLDLAVAAPASIQTVAYGKRQISNVYTMGTTHEYAYLSRTDCEKGRFINEAESRGGRNVCVIGRDVAGALFSGEDPMDKVIRVRDQEYRVIGVFAKQGSFLGIFSWDSQVVIPLASYIKYFKSNEENASIRVKVRDKITNS